MEVKVVIPSHKRADRVATLKAVSDAILCVPKSQESEYRRNNPKAQIITHPDDIIGLAPKRNWIYEKFGNVMMLDDDIRSFYRMYTPVNSLVPSKIDPATMYEVIQATGNMAKELGAFLFGFANVADGRNFKPQSPVKLTGYCNGCSFGLLKGSRIFFHKEATAVEDYFASLLNAYHHRYAFFDTRFGAMQEKTFKNRGGQAEYRTVESEKRDYLFLRRMFGDVVRKRKETNRGKASSEWQRSIHLPF